jgi:hypothetical protein
MNNSVLKRVILILGIVLFIFSLSACETTKAMISFKWGKRTGYEHYLEAKKLKRNIPQSKIRWTMDNEQTINVGNITS